MDAEKFEETMKILLDEFEKSGMTMDEFIKAKLTAAGHQDADAYVAEINATLKDIDAKYASLQEAKTSGSNREEWLRKEMDSVAQDYTPEESGKVFSSTIKVLNGEESDIPDENASYNALDAAFMVRELDDALVKNTCMDLNSEEEK